MIRLQDGTLVPAGHGHAGPGAAHGTEKPGQARGDFLKNLKQAQQQKKSGNITFDKIKQTYNKTELTADNEVENAKKKAALLAAKA